MPLARRSVAEFGPCAARTRCVVHPVVATACLMIGLLSGCQTLRLPVEVESTLPAHTTNEFAALSRRTMWRVSPAWSPRTGPLARGLSQPPALFRWYHPNEEELRGLVQEVAEKGDGSARDRVRVWRELSEQPGSEGVTAAILWARDMPDDAWGAVRRLRQALRPEAVVRGQSPLNDSRRSAAGSITSPPPTSLVPTTSPRPAISPVGTSPGTATRTSPTRTGAPVVPSTSSIAKRPTINGPAVNGPAVNGPGVSNPPADRTSTGGVAGKNEKPSVAAKPPTAATAGLTDSKAEGASPVAAGRSAKTAVEPKGSTGSIALRAAAAEAWCALARRHASRQPADVENAVWDELFERTNDTTLEPEVRGELLRGLSHAFVPADLPGMVSVQGVSANRRDAERIERGAFELRKACVDACLVQACARRLRESEVGPPGENPHEAPVASDDIWPDVVWEFESDPSATIRERFGEWLAAARHPRALEVLLAQQADAELTVRDAAAAHLGLLGTLAARQELEKLYRKGEERTRRAAARGLAAFGPQGLALCVGDKSGVVRSDVVRGLKGFPGWEALKLLRTLAADPRLEVQEATVDCVADWSAELAEPLLIHMLATGAPKSRRLALAQLERRRGGRVPFPVSQGTDERAHAASQLARDWGVPDFMTIEIVALTDRRSPQFESQKRSELEQLLSGIDWERVGDDGVSPAAREWMRQLTADDAAWLERELSRLEPRHVEFVWERMLRRISPAHDAVRRLSQADVELRRRAAQELAQWATDRTLPVSVVRALPQIMAHEQDRLVWRNLMRSVMQDASPETEPLVLLALQHTWPDVRVLGCEYLARHGQFAQGTWVAPLLEDGNPSVLLAAVQAAGACGNPIVLDGVRLASGEVEATTPRAAGTGVSLAAGGAKAGQAEGSRSRGLRRLMRESQGQLKLNVVAAMSRLGDDEGQRELIRMSYDGPPQQRLAVIKEMAATGHSRFASALLRMAWTETNPHVQAAALDAIAQIVPPNEHPPGLGKAKTASERISLWNATAGTLPPS